MADYRLSGRRSAANLSDIPAELMGPVDVWENKEMHPGQLADSRGAVDMTVPCEGEPDARATAPTIILPSPLPGDTDSDLY